MKTVAVIFGGRSVEHDISIITGQFVMSALKAAGQYEVVPIYIAKSGKWYSDPILADIKTFQDPELDGRLTGLKVPIKHTDGRFVLSWPGFKSQHVQIDVVFPALHGTYGEDGSLMGLLRMANVAFVGCDLTAAVITMDKALTKQVTEPAGIPSVPYIWFDAHGWAQNSTELTSQIKKLELPVFVKCVHLGSSIGVFKVDQWSALDNQIEVALHYDDKVIVEQGVKNLIEVNCAVIGNDEPTASLLEQPLASQDLLSFEDKYIGSGSKESGGSMSGSSGKICIPAPISDELTKKIQALAILAYRIIGCSGISRMDFMIDSQTNEVYMTEVNPLPGSLQQHLWKASGVSNVELVSRLIELAEERYEVRQKLATTFTSSVLNQPGGAKR